jgi:hypothetical protein
MGQLKVRRLFFSVGKTADPIVVRVHRKMLGVKKGGGCWKDPGIISVNILPDA